jgi:hypothetical protein
VARHEREFGADAPEPLTPDQVLKLLGAAGGRRGECSDAAAPFFAGADGWKDALHELGGAFAKKERGLIDDQSE